MGVEGNALRKAKGESSERGSHLRVTTIRQSPECGSTVQMSVRVSSLTDLFALVGLATVKSKLCPGWLKASSKASNVHCVAETPFICSIKSDVSNPISAPGEPGITVFIRKNLESRSCRRMRPLQSNGNGLDTSGFESSTIRWCGKSKVTLNRLSSSPPIR